MSETFNTDPVRFLKNGRINIGGLIYYGVVNGDPVNVMGDRIDIFANRALTTALPNPISTGSDGRTAVNGVPAKVWVGGRHSLFELDNKNVEQFQDLDRGETPGTGTPIKLTNVQGTNAITADASPTITDYVDGQIYILGKADGANTATATPWVTLAITGASQGAKPIRFNFNEEIKPGMFQADQEIQLMYNSAGAPTADHFTWVNSGRGISILTNIGGTANAITADGGPSTAGYVDGQHYQFKASATNTGNVTLKVSKPSGFLPEHSILNNGEELFPGDFLLNKNYVVVYNSTGTVFDLISNVFPPLRKKGLQSQQVFTADGTCTRPAGIIIIKVTCVGGGGGGGGSSSSINCGAGGAGETAVKIIDGPATSYSIVVGAFGSGGSALPGGNGGDSILGSNLVGGMGGTGGTTTTAGGDGGTGGTGDYLLDGGRGGSGVTGTANLKGGDGGASSMGGGGGGGTTASSPKLGSAPGSGGGGSVASLSSGAAGKAGIVIIEEYA